jgi:hypothetical protein
MRAAPDRIDLDHGLLFICRNRTAAGYQFERRRAPKTAAGTRAIDLTKHTVKILREHRHRQLHRQGRRLNEGKTRHEARSVATTRWSTTVSPVPVG